jgi:hypothetical protein
VTAQVLADVRGIESGGSHYVRVPTQISFS